MYLFIYFHLFYGAIAFKSAPRKILTEKLQLSWRIIYCEALTWGAEWESVSMGWG